MEIDAGHEHGSQHGSTMGDLLLGQLGHEVKRHQRNHVDARNLSDRLTIVQQATEKVLPHSTGHAQTWHRLVQHDRVPLRPIQSNGTECSL